MPQLPGGAAPLIGRGEEWASIEGLLSGVERGFACLAIEGEAGMGKTTLVRAAVHHARARGLTLLTCSPTQTETCLPFVALGDLLDPIAPEVLATLPIPQREALEVALLRTPPATSADTHGRSTLDRPSSDRVPRPPSQRAIGMALVSLLRRLAQSNPLLLAVDDAQWLDAASADVLQFAVRRLDQEHVCLLTCVRSPSAPHATFDTAIPTDRRQVCRIRGLSVAELHALLSAHLGKTFVRPALHRLAEMSGGNPLHALELARKLDGGAQVPGLRHLIASGDVADVIGGRIRRLPRRTRDALLVAAAMAHPTVDAIDTEALAPAQRARIVRIGPGGRIAFAHPLYASAIYASCAPAERRALHARLARLVPTADERARHQALAVSPPDEGVACALEQGAAEARARGAWHVAADMLQQAVTFTPSHRQDDAARRGITAAEFLVHAGDRHAATEQLNVVLRGNLSGAQRADALRLLGEIRYNAEGFQESLQVLAEARRLTTDPSLVASIELDLAYAASQVWDNRAASEHALCALELAQSLGDDGLLAQALAFRAMSEFLCGRGIEWSTIERAVALEDVDRLVPLHRTPTGVHGLLLLFAGRLDEARQRLGVVRERALARGDESDLSFFACWLAWLETQDGHLDSAQAYVEEAELLAQLTAGTSMQAFAHALRALVSAHRGELERALREGEEASTLAARMTYSIATRWVVVARCFACVSAGDLDGAWEAARTMCEYAESHQIGEPVGYTFLPDALEALIGLGDIRRAAALLDRFEECARRLDRAWALGAAWRCRGLVCAARGDVPLAIDCFERALVEHQRVRMPLERARTLLCLGGAQRRRRLWTAARATLQEALELFEGIGAAAWASKAAAELARTHVRQAPAELSPTEQRVADYAVTGLTNRQIAEHLFISAKTVEANLSRVYTKLNIRSRAELGARMAAAPFRARAPSR